MVWTDYDSRTCSIARTLDVVGERWTLLILRDLFQGVRRFEELRAHLGAPRDVLTKRLGTLVDAGIVERLPYQEPGARQRFEYRPTAAGHELRPVLIALLNWGDTHLSAAEGPPVRVTHTGCGAEVRARLTCAAGHLVESDEALRTDFLTGARPAV